MTKTINQPVTVTILKFKKNLAAYPKRIEYEGTTYDFVDAGLSCTIRSGKGLSRVMTMSDGLKQFRLRSDDRSSIWTLLSMSA